MKERTLKRSLLALAAALLVILCATLFAASTYAVAAWRESQPGEGLTPLPAAGLASQPTPSNRAEELLAAGPAAPSPTATSPVATPSPTPDAPPAQEPAVVTHVVQSGENLYRISLAYGVTVVDIMAENGIPNANLVMAGQTLRIPVSRAVAAPAGTAVPESPTGQSPTASAPTVTPAPLPRIGVNGLPLEAILVMPENVRQNARLIFALGQELDRDPAVYSKLGDSTIENPHFMARFDEGQYVLGDYAYLQEAIDHFAGSHGRQGVAVRRGFHSWTVNDPLWADKSLCLPNEDSVRCEIRLNNPSVMLIRLGSNDAGVPAGFEQNMRQVIDIVIENGVLPVLATKADRFEGSNINNDIIRRLASDYQLPLWDFDRVAGTIPGRGLDVDGVHLTTFYPHDYTSPTAFQRGHSMHNLTALMTLDVILREVIRESE